MPLQGPKPHVSYAITEGQLVRLCDGNPEDSIDCDGAFDLLEALQFLVDTVARETDWAKPSLHSTHQSFAAGRAAIAKAKGE